MTAAIICDVRDPLNHEYRCTLDDGHEGAHKDDRYPPVRWCGGSK